jgi:hypothetical protein
MAVSAPGFAQRIAPWLLAVTLAVALWIAYRNGPPDELLGGGVRHDVIPACKTNPIQVFDAAIPTVSPDLCWAHSGDRIIWTFPNNPTRVFHVHMSPHPFTSGVGAPFEADSVKGVIVSDPLRQQSDYIVYKYALTYDGGNKRVEAQILLMK